MIATSAPAPAPTSHTKAFVLLSKRRRKSSKVKQAEREAFAQLASIARNIRFDMTNPRPGGASRITPEYVQEIGLRVLEVVDRHRLVVPRDWDAMIERASIASGQ